MLCDPWTEVALCGVLAIALQVVCQLVVDTWSVNCLKLERSGDRPLVQSANLIVGLGDYSYLFVYVRNYGLLSDLISIV